MGRLLEFPKPIEDELPGFTECICGEILADHRKTTRNCPIIEGNMIVGYSAVRLFRVGYYNRDLPLV